MKNKIQLALLLLMILISTHSFAQEVFMDADSTGNAYSRITSKLFNYEVPDCWHKVIHMTEGWDSSLNKYVFLFNLHWADGIGGTASPVNDNDRCINYDRQRTELKVDAGSPAYMQGQYGDTHHYRWKFKIDSSFQTETSFTHVHQLKPGDGTVDTDNPLITISLIKSTKGIDSLQLRYISTIETGSVTTHLKDAILTPFRGNWVEVYETVKYSDTGSYSVTIKKVSDETVLFTYNNNNIWLWRTGITYVRPKWGLYRSLDDSTDIRSETVKFADFALLEGTTSTTPAAPGNLNASYLSGGRIKLTWTDNSTNEDQFRIDRSTNGTTWAYYATAIKNLNTYTDSVTATNTYYYRVRAENVVGNSAFSNTVSYYFIPSVQLSLMVLIEGLYNGTSMVSDTVTVELHNSSSPYTLVESQTGVLSTAGVGTFTFTTVSNGKPYYIVVKSLNTIETWSVTAQSFTSGALNYNFTTAAAQAYGSNLIQIGSKWCIYSGDVNQDGLCDSGDILLIDNDYTNYLYGPGMVTDVNGDGVVDSGDILITDNNYTNYIYAAKPDGALAKYIVHIRQVKLQVNNEK